jgi:hypothetical protein
VAAHTTYVHATPGPTAMNPFEPYLAVYGQVAPERPWWTTSGVRVDGAVLGLSMSEWYVSCKGLTARLCSVVWNPIGAVGREPVNRIGAIDLADNAFPRPAPVAMPGQVWGFPYGSEQIIEHVISTVHREAGMPREVLWSNGERAIFHDGVSSAWPPPGQVLLHGIGAPWAPPRWKP